MRFSLQVRYNDYDTKGHINNAVYLSYFEIARVEAWRAVSGDVDSGYIVAEARITYRSPAILGDPLAIEVTTAEVRNKAWVWRYRIVDERDERLIAEGETTQVMYDYDARATILVPDATREALGRI
jgi:acyl-CoA thioester hydrolase